MNLHFSHQMLYDCSNNWARDAAPDHTNVKLGQILMKYRDNLSEERCAAPPRPAAVQETEQICLK